MTDTETLIEGLMSDADRSDMGRKPDPTDRRRVAAQAVRDLTAEVARLKALGDGLAGYAQHRWPCMKSPPSGGIPANECTCGLSTALAAWEKNSDQ